MNKTRNSKTWLNRRFNWRLGQIYHHWKMTSLSKRRRNLKSTENSGSWKLKFVKKRELWRFGTKSIKKEIVRCRAQQKLLAIWMVRHLVVKWQWVQTWDINHPTYFNRKTSFQSVVYPNSTLRLVLMSKVTWGIFHTLQARSIITMKNCLDKRINL